MESFTCDKFQRRNPHLALSPSWCVLCRSDGETIDHILLHCKMARLYWQNLLNEAGVGLLWAFPAEYKSVMVESMAGFGSIRMAKVSWRCMVILILWVLGWKEEMPEF